MLAFDRNGVYIICTNVCANCFRGAEYMATLADVAALAGCSVSVVSRVLKPRDGGSDRIAPATRDRVREAALELGYRPNRTAEFLKYGRVPEIGVFLPNFNNSLILDIVRGSSEAAREAGFPLSFFFDQQIGSFGSFMHDTIGRKNCGIITCAPELEAVEKSFNLIKNYCDAGGYVVLIDNCKRGLVSSLRATEVLVDDEYGGVLAATRLLECGCENFFLQAPRRPRAFGFVRYLEAAGREVTWLPKSEAGTGELFQMLMNYSGKAGVFCSSDRLAIRLYSRLAGAGEIPGNRIKLIGYDDTYNSDVLSPALTSIRQPFFESGRLAVKYLLDMIYNRPIEPEILKPVLIGRQTA